jgi:tetratricopeptide (TPR) repeat protein
LLQGLRSATFILLFVLSTKVAAAPVAGSLSYQGDTVHAEFEGRPTWNYNLKKVVKDGKTLAELTLESVNDRTIKAFSEFKSEFVRNVQVDPKGPDGRTVILFELAGNDIETFDYLTDQPSRLIVDFYMTDVARARRASTAAKSKTETKSETAKSTKSVPKGKTGATKVADGRKPAATDALVISQQGMNVALNGNEKEVRSGIFDGGDPDYDRFSIKDYEVKEEAILRSKENYYIPFPMLMSSNEAFDKVRAAAPVYSIAPKDTAENKMARLLLTLFERKRFAVYLKTLAWFREQYPNSEYNDLIAYMTGDVHLHRWKEKGQVEDYELAAQAFQSAVQKYPEAAPAERTSLLLGVMALDRGDSLGAIRAFNSHVVNSKFGAKNVYSKDLAKLGSGFAFLKLFRFDEALKAFDDVEQSSTFKDLKTEAAYRKGDVYTASKQYVKAIESYQQAIKDYPTGRIDHPGATFNQAEAMFLTGSYRPSLEVFRDFIKGFPSDEHSPFAMTRLGELLEVLGADSTRVVGAYLETYFRFGENPRAIIARLRLLSTRMRAMKSKDADSAVKEILSLAKKSDLPNIEQFATVLIADGYTGRGDHQKAIDLLTKYYQENPTSADLEPLKKRIVSNIADKFRTEVNAGKFIEGLRTHQRYADGWLKTADRLDTKFYLARAFEISGVPQEAQDLYQDVLNRMHAVKGTPQEKSLQVLQNLPTSESLHLRLAAVSADRKNLQKAYDHLREIKQPEKMSDSEQIERVELAVRLLENRGDLDSAARYLTELLKAWQGKPEMVAGSYAELARIELKQGKKEDAIQSLKKIDTLMKDSSAVAPQVHARALESLGDLYLEMGNKEQAAAVYSDLLNRYEEQRPLASIRYRLGRIFFDRGDVQKAAETWNTFKGQKTDFWKNLAQEQLKNSEWREDYKKYIKRIPAMAR